MNAEPILTGITGLAILILICLVTIRHVKTPKNEKR